MGSWLQLAAARRPDQVALETPSRALTYEQLLREAAGLAGRLRRDGVGAGARVAIELPPGERFVVALHACLLVGAAAMPVDLRLAESERARRRAGSATSIDELAVQLDGGASSPAQDSAFDPADVVAVLHTSGTTAEPRRVELTAGNFLHSALASAAMLGLDRDERWLCPMPLTHVGGLSIPVRSAIYATTVVLHGRFDTDAVLAELMSPERRITLVSLVPTMLARLFDAGLAAPPTLRWALLGGGPIPPTLLERAERARVPVAPTYGMTEACSQIATFGYPLPGVQLRLERSAWPRAAPPSAGEILVRGPIVSPEALAADGWLHTGDLGAFDERGALQIVGRLAETIVTGGENVAPAEVEAVLLEHPDVVDAGVFGRPDPEWGEAVIATVVLRDGVVASPERLREFCAARIARHKVPKQINFASALPRTASGKLLRRRLS